MYIFIYIYTHNYIYIFTKGECALAGVIQSRDVVTTAGIIHVIPTNTILKMLFAFLSLVIVSIICKLLY